MPCSFVAALIANLSFHRSLRAPDLALAESRRPQVALYPKTIAIQATGEILVVGADSNVAFALP